MRNRLAIAGAIALSAVICATVTPRQTARVGPMPLTEAIHDAGTAKSPTFENTQTVKKRTPTIKNEPVVKKETTTEITPDSLANYDELFSPTPDRDCTLPEIYWGQMTLLAQERFAWIETNQEALGRLLSTTNFDKVYEVLGRPTSESVLETTHPLNDIILFLAATQNPNQELKTGIINYIDQIPDLHPDARKGLIDAIDKAYICGILGNLEARQTDPTFDDALVVFGIIGLPSRCE